MRYLYFLYNQLHSCGILGQTVSTISEEIQIFHTNHVTIQVSFHFFPVRASFMHQPLLTELSMGCISGTLLHDCYTEHGSIYTVGRKFKKKGGAM